MCRLFYFPIYQVNNTGFQKIEPAINFPFSSDIYFHMFVLLHKTRRKKHLINTYKPACSFGMLYLLRIELLHTDLLRTNNTNTLVRFVTSKRASRFPSPLKWKKNKYSSLPYIMISDYCWSIFYFTFLCVCISLLYS